MQTEDEIVDKLTREGYLVVFPWQALPGEVDFPHAHATDSVQVVLSGEITFQVDEADSVVRAGQTHVVPARTVHSAVCGPEGCNYIFALK